MASVLTRIQKLYIFSDKVQWNRQVRIFVRELYRQEVHPPQLMILKKLVTERRIIVRWVLCTVVIVTMKSLHERIYIFYLI